MLSGGFCGLDRIIDVASNHLDIGRVSCCSSGPEGRRSEGSVSLVLMRGQKRGEGLTELARLLPRRLDLLLAVSEITPTLMRD